MSNHEFSNSDHSHLLSANWPRCEERIKAFEQAWQRGESPRIEAYLSPADGDQRALLVELVHADLEFRAKSGQPVEIETYLAAYPEIADDPEILRDLIRADYELHKRFRLAVSLADYRRRFPAVALDFPGDLTIAETDTRGPSSSVSGPIPWPDVAGYEIVCEIGRGGMGVVYKAREPSLDRFVALKFLPPDYAREPERLGRFVREARTASALNHPNICTIHALGEHGGRPFIVMEFIEGFTLQALSATDPEANQISRVIRQAARALAAAHAAGVVHRDIKPDNIMVRDDGYVKVLDFGLARQVPALGHTDEPSAHDTKPGSMLGTIAYMSPEQAAGAAIDSASDIFSLGIVLYQLLTKQHPFAANSPLNMLHAIANAEPIAAAQIQPTVTASLDGLIAAMLQKDPRLRPTAADVELALVDSRLIPLPRAANTLPRRPIVHRQQELAALHSALANADAGTGSLIALAGEPGIGKTTLVEDFFNDLSVSSRRYLVARGQCSQRLTNTEAYLPVIHALDDLLRYDRSGVIARLLQAVAPAWAAQLKPSVVNAPVPTAHSPSQALSQQGMLREFYNLLREAARVSPIVLFFDDVHWADVPTVELLAHVGQQIAGLRILLIVTYRPTELLLGPHPFHRVKLDLQAKGHCTELALRFLQYDDIHQYLSIAFPDNTFPETLAAAIHARTEGNPLFMADLMTYLRERGVIVHIDGRWTLARQLPDLRSELPESVRSMIQRKLDGLQNDDRRLLAAASVQGHEFDSAVLAGALEREPADVEDQLQTLDRIHSLVRSMRSFELPDRTWSVRYTFVHILYQQALYDELSPSRRAALAATLARQLQRHHGEAATVLAAELACLYEVARDPLAAARQFWLASQNAGRVFAHHEALELSQRGLRLLQSIPESAERNRLELELQTMLGLQLQVTKGYAAPQAQLAYARARELNSRALNWAADFPVLWGLWLYHKVRSHLDQAQEMAEELLALARRMNEPALALQAHQALGMTAFCQGRQSVALWNVEHVATLYDPVRHREHSSMFGQDPGVICKAYGGVVLWLLGFPDSAVQQCEAAIELSRDRSPTSQAVALHFSAMVHQLRGDVPRTLISAQQAAAIAAEHRLSFWSAGAAVLSGWASARGASAHEGLAQLRRGLIDWRATGSVTYETYYLCLLADVLLQQAEWQEAGQVLEQAHKLAADTGEGLILPELHRLRGILLLRTNSNAEETPGAGSDATLYRALDIAREQQAKSLALRVAVSLVQHGRSSGASDDREQLLRQIYESFFEGLDTPDLRQAQSLLA